VIKFLARDAEAGRLGTYQTSFTIPNLNREEVRLPISSVVLSSQRVPFGEELHTVKNSLSTQAQANNPLVFQGEKAGAERHARLQHHEGPVRAAPGLRARRHRDGALSWPSSPCTRAT
jgi:hypothetical protein